MPERPNSGASDIRVARRRQRLQHRDRVSRIDPAEDVDGRDADLAGGIAFDQISHRGRDRRIRKCADRADGEVSHPRILVIERPQQRLEGIGCIDTGKGDCSGRSYRWRVEFEGVSQRRHDTTVFKERQLLDHRTANRLRPVGAPFEHAIHAFPISEVPGDLHR